MSLDSDREAIDALTVWLHQMRRFPCFKHLDSEIEIGLHDHCRSLGLWRPSLHSISLHAVLVFHGSKREVGVTLAHECAHAARTEPQTGDPHDGAWCRLMWKAGLDPISHAIVPDGVFAAWWERQVRIYPKDVDTLAAGLDYASAPRRPF